jgi:hypothetical protein
VGVVLGEIVGEELVLGRGLRALRLIMWCLWSWKARPASTINWGDGEGEVRSNDGEKAEAVSNSATLD